MATGIVLTDLIFIAKPELHSFVLWLPAAMAGNPLQLTSVLPDTLLADNQTFRCGCCQYLSAVLRQYHGVGDEIVDNIGVGEPAVGVEHHAGLQDAL